MGKKQTLIQEMNNIAQEVSKKKNCNYTRIQLICGYYNLYSIDYREGVIDKSAKWNVDKIVDFTDDLFEGEIIRDKNVLDALTKRLADESKRKKGECYLDIVAIFNKRFDTISTIKNIAMIKISPKGYKLLEKLQKET